MWQKDHRPDPRDVPKHSAAKDEDRDSADGDGDNSAAVGLYHERNQSIKDPAGKRENFRPFQGLWAGRIF